MVITMAFKHKITGFLGLIVVAAVFGGLAYLSRGPYKMALTIHELLKENKQLKQAVTNLTKEDQIGFAKVLKQWTQDDKLFTTLKFVETARDDKLKRILEKEYTIEGDIVHFDALIVKFGSNMVMDGRGRALYLWRRIYGEKMAPEQGFEIEEPGTEPLRYGDLFEALPIEQRHMFWSHIWDLANDGEKLKQYDIEAVYGNVVYTRLKEGLIYIFKITSSGQVTPEIVPDM